jgi:hypothetical protein
MSVKAYRKRAEVSEKDIEAGQVKDIEMLEKESDNW